MLDLFSSPYFTQKKNGITQFQLLQAYLLGSAFQTICDNPVTAYRQMVQQYSTNLSGKIVSPALASVEAQKTFKKNRMNGIARHAPGFVDYCAEFARLKQGFVQWTRNC